MNPKGRTLGWQQESEMMRPRLGEKGHVPTVSLHATVDSNKFERGPRGTYYHVVSSLGLQALGWEDSSIQTFRLLLCCKC